MKLTYRQLADLAWAVREAEGWRGSIVGNPDTTQLKAFDATIKRCKEALKLLREGKKK